MLCSNNGISNVTSLLKVCFVTLLIFIMQYCDCVTVSVYVFFRMSILFQILFLFSICHSLLELTHVMTLSKPEARQACNTLNLVEGSRLEMIERIGHALLNPSSEIDNGLVLFMDKEDSNSDDNLNVIWMILPFVN